MMNNLMDEIESNVKVLESWTKLDVKKKSLD
jgi:hypothetical protein